ncbi:MAG: type II toxin-antitoxin system VapC family toxin [Alphaproteobacteria bacterium]|nr:type II toxin-antitoxin system VapC family toxin [Alphaproteobacteria bacterium]
MKLTLDSHAFFWWVVDHSALTDAARAALEDPDNEVYVSAVVPWEIVTKVRLGKWPEARAVAENFEAALERSSFLPLAITLQHARVAGFLQGRHGDPFDRMLAAQSQIECMPLVTAHPVFKSLGIRVIW